MEFHHRLIAVVVALCGLQDCQGASWGYTGADGVDQWATNFPTCGGTRQSPIDITSSMTKYDSNLGAFSFSNFNTIVGLGWSFANNGHSVTVSVTSGTLQVTGGNLITPYQVAQFHWHWGSDDTKGSEHTLQGKMYPLELHIVTFNTKYSNLTNALGYSDGLAVLGFFYEAAATDNAIMKHVVDDLPNIKYAGNVSMTLPAFKLSDLMPADLSKYYRYPGSLTTPSCNEIVTWTVFKSTIPISTAQLAAFRTLMDSHNHTMEDNYRPVQPLKNRLITASYDDAAFIGSTLAGSADSVGYRALTVITPLVVALLSRL